MWWGGCPAGGTIPAAPSIPNTPHYALSPGSGRRHRSAGVRGQGALRGQDRNSSSQLLGKAHRDASGKRAACPWRWAGRGQRWPAVTRLRPEPGHNHCIQPATVPGFPAPHLHGAEPEPQKRPRKDRGLAPCTVAELARTIWGVGFWFYCYPSWGNGVLVAGDRFVFLQKNPCVDSLDGCPTPRGRMRTMASGEEREAGGQTPGDTVWEGGYVVHHCACAVQNRVQRGQV